MFEFEPVGAAARYAARLDHDELIVVADYGGGTTDFSAIRVGRGDAHVLATGGIGVSGDAFDARVIDAVVAPALGRGTRYRVDEMGGTAPVPAWIYGHLRRWHLLSFLKEESTQRLLARVTHGAEAPAAIERLTRVVEEDLGLPLHQAVEGAKVRLSLGDADRVALPALDSICRRRAPRSTRGSPRISTRSIACSTTCSASGRRPPARSIACSRPAAARSCPPCTAGSPRGSAPTRSWAAKS